MNTEIIGGEHSKMGTAHIESGKIFTPEKFERIITEDGLVKYGEEVKKLAKAEGERAKTGISVVLDHIIKGSPEDTTFIEQSGVHQRIAETNEHIDELVIKTQEEITGVTVDI
ncbi:MAG: hypothetical protein WCG73_02815 [Candidatus Moraniibacteriota bacterium]